MDGGDGTLFGLLSILAGSVTSIVIALVTRSKGGELDTGPSAPALAPAMEDDPDDADLTTVEGIARMVVRQGRRIRQLEAASATDRARIGALYRYMLVLKSTITRLGAPVPEPDPRDADLIEH
ncbi:hypothetical protein OG194_29525 [Streptomyces sp. NBC_01288]|uniref:hypothetical protein n=1 Tax=Streptomyces sp. NBC_01288 TaxID=2903814 RepID=UPI002E15EC64|nr:hypothetical protein OG194_29525 [Streptomyces sp. NBC_01288]